MTFSVPEQDIAEFKELARSRGVEVSDLGEFTDDGNFRIQYDGKTVGLIKLDFLHHGVPQMNLQAKWDGPREPLAWRKPAKTDTIDPKVLNSREFLENALFQLLARWNVRSKEELVRRYDHEVQAATVVKPFVGAKGDGPGDSSVIWLGPHGGSETAGIAIGCGLTPKYSRFDTYLMAQLALDEAIRNCVSVGADPDKVALTDNFCWPDPLPGDKNPDAEYKLAQLVRACRGLYDLSRFYGSPFVSGKDSMKNDFIGKSRFGKEVKISVPPTVLVTAMAHVPDVSLTVTSDFKQAGDKVYLLGVSYRDLGGSELEAEFNLPDEKVRRHPPQLNAHKNQELYRRVHQATLSGLINSCHDCSEGGLMVALAESAIGGNLGLEVDLEDCADNFQNFGGSLLEYFFNESPGRFVVSVSPDKEEAFLSKFEGLTCTPFGSVSDSRIMRVSNVGLVLIDAPLSRITEAWKGNAQ